MTPDYVYVYEHNTVDEVLNVIRKVARNIETVDVIYIINEKGTDDDIKTARHHSRNNSEKRMDDLVDGRIVSLNVIDDQEHATQVFKMNNRVALPVTDDNNILVLAL